MSDDRADHEGELGAFLRARRQQLQPDDVGLRGGGRRRTPGLRREEVASRAGVSVDYLVRLEQGRDVNPSADVLANLAKALLLSDDERLHLGQLAAVGRNRSMCPDRTTAEREVAPTVRMLLDRLEPTPAFVAGPFGDVLLSNQAWQAVAAPTGMLERPVPNIARYLFTDPRARSVFPEWDVVADEHVAQLRAASLRWGEDPGLRLLIGELETIADFESRWSRHAVDEHRRGAFRMVVDGSAVRIAYEVLHLADPGEQRLVTWLPADDAAAAHLATLQRASSPASRSHLRAVSS